MADKDFVVKNGLAVNTTILIGNSTVNASVNSTIYSGTANNASYLGTYVATAYLKLNDNAVLSGNINFTGTNNVFGSRLLVGANVIANTTSWFVGNSTANAYLTSAGLYVDGTPFTSGGGYYKGNAGTLGSPSNANSLFRINANTMTADVTIAAGENAQVTGPLTIQSSKILTIQTGGRVAII